MNINKTLEKIVMRVEGGRDYISLFSFVFNTLYTHSGAKGAILSIKRFILMT